MLVNTSPRRVFNFLSLLTVIMDILHTQLNNIQRHLPFVAVDDIDWRFYVQLFSWSVSLFESYLLCGGYFLVKVLPVSNIILFQRIRQYPLYSKKEPPASLASHFEPGVFEKSQNYGKDKAKFALFSGIFKQLLDSFMLQSGFYAWSWVVSQNIMTKIGYGQGYEVKKTSFIKLRHALNSELLSIDISVHLVCFCLVHPFNYPDNPFASLWNLCT